MIAGELNGSGIWCVEDRMRALRQVVQTSLFPGMFQGLFQRSEPAALGTDVHILHDLAGLALHNLRHGLHVLTRQVISAYHKPTRRQLLVRPFCMLRQKEAQVHGEVQVSLSQRLEAFFEVRLPAA